MAKKNVLFIIFILNFKSSISELFSYTDITENSNPYFPTCEYREGDYEAITQAIENALDFNEKNIQYLVPDSAIPTRILEAQSKLILKSHPNLPPDIRNFMKKLHRRSFKISKDIATSRILLRKDLSPIEKEEKMLWVKSGSLWETPAIGGWEHPEVLERHTKAFNKNWTFPRTFEPTLENEPLKSVSDYCISEIIRGNCNISSDCSEAILSYPLSMYSITHQVLYMLFAKMKSCKNKKSFTKYFDKGDPNSFVKKLCGKVKFEADTISNYDFPPQFRDLFPEQVAFCALSGFSNFLRLDWLDKMLSWQSKSSGCFVGSSKMIHYLREAGFANNRRKKREDFLILSEKENCSTHFTAVTLSALAVHLRFLIDSCF